MMMMMMVRVSVKIRSLMSSRLLAGEMLLLYLGEYFRSCRIDAVVVVRFSISVYVHVTVNSAVDTLVSWYFFLPSKQSVSFLT